jgi:hypothetical protein
MSSTTIASFTVSVVVAGPGFSKIFRLTFMLYVRKLNQTQYTLKTEKVLTINMKMLTDK